MLARKLEYLIALAKEGHFARAATACHVSQPALSAGIQQLEHELGVQIVKRGQRFQGLTEQGEVVLAWAQKMELECKKLHLELRDRTDQLSGTLRVGVMNSTTPFTTIFTLAFQQRFPEVNLRVISQNPFEIQQGLEDYTYDVAFNFLDDKAPRHKLSHPLYKQEYYLLSKTGSAFSGKQSLTWDQVKELPLCLYPSETQIFDPQVYETLGDARPGARVETNAMLVLLDYVRSGKWASILPKPVLFMVAGSDEFEVTPLPPSLSAGTIGIAVPHRDPPCHLAEVFFEIATSSEVLDKFNEFFLPTVLSERK